MKKTIKIIDLLVKIANNEEVPKKIKYRNNIYEYCNNDNRYHKETNEYPDKNGNDLSKVIGMMNFNYLNDEVEIIEEDNKIEKIELDDECIVDYDETGRHYLNTNRKDRNIYVKKINELIDEVNKLKEK